MNPRKSTMATLFGKARLPEPPKADEGTDNLNRSLGRAKTKWGTEEFKQLNLKVPRDVFDRMRLLVAKEKMPANELFVKMLEEYEANHGRPTLTMLGSDDVAK